MKEKSKFQCVTVFQDSVGPFDEKHGHIMCENADERKKLVDSLKSFHPKATIIERELDCDSVREEVPFVHHPMNAGSCRGEHFFKISRWYVPPVNFPTPPEAIFMEISPEEFMEAFHMATKLPNERIVDIY